ncbi:MAG: accessory gene regulator B family protein, partial [Clostridiales bacterium]|nr:accessory gene regulator B family protein [Clostridiales bacterium]
SAVLHGRLKIQPNRARLNFAMAPLDSTQKPLDDDEQGRYRRTSRIIALVYAAIGAASVIAANGALCHVMAVVMILESCLLAAGKAERLRDAF